MTRIEAAQELRAWEQMNPNAHPTDRARVAGALFACIDPQPIKSAPVVASVDEQLTEWRIGGAL